MYKWIEVVRYQQLLSGGPGDSNPPARKPTRGRPTERRYQSTLSTGTTRGVFAVGRSQYSWLRSCTSSVSNTKQWRDMAWGAKWKNENSSETAAADALSVRINLTDSRDGVGRDGLHVVGGQCDSRLSQIQSCDYTTSNPVITGFRVVTRIYHSAQHFVLSCVRPQTLLAPRLIFSILWCNYSEKTFIRDGVSCDRLSSNRLYQVHYSIPVADLVSDQLVGDQVGGYLEKPNGVRCVT